MTARRIRLAAKVAKRLRFTIPARRRAFQRMLSRFTVGVLLATVVHDDMERDLVARIDR